MNPTRHPDGLLDVASAIEKTDKRYLLWFEPERVRKNMPIAGEHPEYLIWPADEKFPEALMNLGREDSPYDRATLPLFGLQDGKEYVFEDVTSPMLRSS